MIQSILSNIAILLFMHLCIQSLYFHRERFFSQKIIPVLHVLFTASSIIFMYYMPIFIGEYRFDLRAIPMTFITFLHGPLYAIPTFIIAALWRLGIGGPGAIPGIFFGLLLPSLVALAVYYLKVKRLSHWQAFFLFSLFWLSSDLSIIYVLPSGWEVFQDIAFARFLSFQLGASTLYFFIYLANQHLELVEKLKRYADEDPLTGLYNIRKFAEMLHDGKPKGVHFIAMMDIDFFKSINDTYGHQNGDKVLKDFARMIREFHPKRLTVGRYGGEEFILAISVEEEREAVHLIDQLRKHIENSSFYSIDEKKLKSITVSAGVARYLPEKGIEDAIQKADQYLYKAKQRGRNRVVADATLNKTILNN